MTNRLILAALGLICVGFAAPSAATAQSSAADLVVKIDQLENQMRQLTGMVEQLQYRNQQLEAALKRMQDDTEYRFQELGARGGSRAPAAPQRPAAMAQPMSPPPPVNAPINAAPTAPVPTATGRRSDAFDPAASPSAPGAPRVLGSVYGNSPAPRGDSGVPMIMSEEPAESGRQPGAPLDLTTMAGAAANDPGLARPGRPAPVGANALPPPGPNPPSYAVATAPPSQTPRDSFDMGYGYLQRKDYALAEESFRDFLKRYPTDRMAADAQYWLGESMYQRQSYRDAADAFLALSKKYENSVKAPDALLRLGQSLAAINEKELACATFGEVVRKYPRVSPSVKQSVEREQKRVRC